MSLIVVQKLYNFLGGFLMRKLISGCMITKNEGEYLKHSLDSIIDYVDEMIIVDDMSTDATMDIIASYGKKIKVIRQNFDRDKKQQRQVYLLQASGKWIFCPDGDEVYLAKDLQWMRNIMMTDNHNITIVTSFLHFWKDYQHVITGHVWAQILQRIYKNINGIGYYDTHHSVSIKPNVLLYKYAKAYNRILVNKNFKIYHYSYCKNSVNIRKKVEYYMRRDNPNCRTEERVISFADRHPYFSCDFTQLRYNLREKAGLYCCGTYKNTRDKVVKFSEQHPEIIKKHPKYPILHKYVQGMNDYMEKHWQFHNHLDHARHQARIILTGKQCIGSTIDVGCANGFSTALMQKNNPLAKFSGVEATDWGYNQAIIKFPHIKFYKCMGENLLFRDKSFDTVLLSEIIEHCQDPRILANEAWRVCKKRLIITTPTKNHPDPDHKRFFPVESMIEFLKPYGKPTFVGLNKQGILVQDISKIYFNIAIINKEK